MPLDADRWVLLTVDFANFSGKTAQPLPKEGMAVSQQNTLRHFLSRELDVSGISPTPEESDALVRVGCSISSKESEHVLKIVVIDVKIKSFA